jgi:hypothetical protein
MMRCALVVVQSQARTFSPMYLSGTQSERAQVWDAEQFLEELEGRRDRDISLMSGLSSVPGIGHGFA